MSRDTPFRCPEPGQVRLGVVGPATSGRRRLPGLAWLGHTVVGVDSDRARVQELSAGQLPLYGPRLAELLFVARRTGRLSFSDHPSALASGEVLFFCAETPPQRRRPARHLPGTGSGTLTGDQLDPGTIVVNKFTVPVGSGTWVRAVWEEALPAGREARFGQVSNPEFLREGTAVADFLHTDRIVLGSPDAEVGRVAEVCGRVLEQDFSGGNPTRCRQLYLTDLTSTEMIKCAANAFLAPKISLANEFANLCELVGVDARQVLPAVGADLQIGAQLLSPGIGRGASVSAKISKPWSPPAGSTCTRRPCCGP